MKVYFNASLAGKQDYLGAYQKIVEIIKDMGHKVEAEHVLDREAEKVNLQREKEHEKDFQKVKSTIQKCDAMIVEGTYPSVGVGYLISIALDLRKPVLILYLTTPHGLLIGDPNRLLTIARYSSGKNKELKKVLDNFLKRAKNKVLTCKFDLMISEYHNKYLKWVVLKNKISKAEFLRNLIDEKINSDSEYKKTEAK